METKHQSEHSAQKRLFDLFNELGIKTETIEHHPAKTIEDIQSVSLPGPACKNLFLKDKRKRFWLVSALPDTKINLKQLAKKLEAPDLRFAQAELLQEHLGIEPGAVTLFAILNDTEHKVNVVLDKALYTQELVGFHPLRNSASTMIAPPDIPLFLKGCGHTATEVDFSE